MIEYSIETLIPQLFYPSSIRKRLAMTNKRWGRNLPINKNSHLQIVSLKHKNKKK